MQNGEVQVGALQKEGGEKNEERGGGKHHQGEHKKKMLEWMTPRVHASACAHTLNQATESSLIWRQKRDEAEKGGRSREDQGANWKRQESGAADVS